MAMNPNNGNGGSQLISNNKGQEFDGEFKEEEEVQNIGVELPEPTFAPVSPIEVEAEIDHPEELTNILENPPVPPMSFPAEQLLRVDCLTTSQSIAEVQAIDVVIVKKTARLSLDTKDIRKLRESSDESLTMKF
eukprot:4030201-Ditylum_brightwellii.AAC.1